MSQSSFVCNRSSQKVFDTLVNQLSTCSEFKMSVAFITYGGLQILLDTFKQLEDNNIKGEILTSTYLHFTQPKALEKLASFKNISLKIFVPNEDFGFHTKGYLFKTDDNDNNSKWTVLIGSSNITASALKCNMEWNVLNSENKGTNDADKDNYTQDVLSEFEKLWESEFAKDYSTEFLLAYRDYLKNHPKVSSENKELFAYDETIRPNRMQQEAIIKLDAFRKNGERKALAIAATGSGKTYMSVFDAMQFNPNKLLFIVHRDQILNKAKESFDRVLAPCFKDNYTSGFFNSIERNTSAKYIFAMKESLAKNLEQFSEDAFDYIVIDEAHHATSAGYKQILDYFKPKFLLGLTATPERCDSGDVFSLFDNNVAVEIRLRDALYYDLVCPFHYFGITDADGIDYTKLKKAPGEEGYLDEVAKLLMVSRRVDYIIEKLKFYDHDGDGKAKILGFCANTEHAKYMADEFNKRLSPDKKDFAVALLGADSPDVRDKYVKKLEDDNDPLNVIFTVDIFNEGVDIPSVNTILMLRPTASPIIFVQQLGRGLRKLPNKEFVTVLDFIGNYQKSFLMAIALNGKTNYDRDSLKVAVKNNFADIPGSTHIYMDKISKKQILKQLEQEKFYSKKYLRDNYFSFKKINGNKIPMLTDYLKQDGAYDPLNFTKTSYSTYFDFVKDVEFKNNQELPLLVEPVGEALLKFIHNLLLPAKRPYEFVTVKELFNAKEHQLKVGDIFARLDKYIEDPSKATFDASVNFLCGANFDANELKSYQHIMLQKDGDTLSLNRSVIEFLNNQHNLKEWVKDALEYGLRRYEAEFGTINYGVPFFKLHARYSMRDTALLCNYEKTHSAIRGQGLFTSLKRDYLLFVDLYKEEGIKESINYDDYFVSSKEFHWQSPNSTKQDSEIGSNLINNVDNKVNLHLFVRKYPKVENVTATFVYVGKVNTIKGSAKGNKPISMNFRLENELPSELYEELTTIVKLDKDEKD